MTAENGNGKNEMQNPGDPRVPEGVVIEPARRILIVNVEPGNYDQVVKLNGSESTKEDEEQALKETTIP